MLYDFSTLSPLDFEDLVRDLLQAEEGMRLESFGAGRDHGIDFRFASDQVSTIVQAKMRKDINALLTAMKAENAKVAALKPSRYILATNVSMTDDRKKNLISVLPNAPLNASDIFGLEDLNNLLGRHEAILKLHFKLWITSTAVLERVLHNNIYNRTAMELDEIRVSLPKFVQNGSVAEAEKTLEAHKVLIISGKPGVGKAPSLAFCYGSTYYKNGKL